MFISKTPVEQTDPPLSPRETLPTMYDLPSENQEEKGLPDHFHYLQPQLLSFTFCPPNYTTNQVFSSGDMNLYYNVRCPLWYKRPDWMGVVGVPRLYDEKDLRLSYVIWQEGVTPFIIVELLSPGTENEDLGETKSRSGEPPTKWEVYEKILRIPYYVVFDRYTDRLKVFVLQAGFYQELPLTEPRFFLPEIELGLGLWWGEYEGISRLWLRWFDAEGNWILTEAESAQKRAEEAEQKANSEQKRAEEAEQKANSEQKRAEEAEQRAEYLAEKLRELGVEI